MRKEVLHIMRDARSLIIVFVLPVMMIVLYGYALNMDVKHISFAVFDEDRSPASRALVEAFVRSGYFDLRARPARRAEAEALLRSQEARVVLAIPATFAADLNRPAGGHLQLLVDGSDATTATVALNYADLIAAQYAQDRASGTVSATALPVIPEPRVWYNPDLKSANFLVPGLMATILMMISALLTSITIAREKETGTLEQILVSPIRPWEIIVGKVAPYLVLAFLDGLLVLAVGKLLFHIPIRGSLTQLLGLSVIYLFAALSIGLLISTMVATQQQAMMSAQLVTTLPSFLLSGFIFPLRSMPHILQAISYIVPAKYYLIIIRGIILKGLDARAFAPQVGFLLVLAAVLVTLSTWRFRTRLG
jgi:ABC-2 type transport system permease protein